MHSTGTLRRNTVVGVLMVALTAIAAPAAHADGDPGVDFGVGNALEACVRDAVHIPSPQAVPASSVAALTHLHCDALSQGVDVDLTPLAAASALMDLRVRQAGTQRPSLVMPVDGLPSLAGLEISGYTVNGGATAAAPQLQTLTLDNSSVEALRALSPSAAIVSLSLSTGTVVGDWSDLATYSALAWVTVSDLAEFDLGVLPVTPALTSIEIYRTPTSAWEALSALSQLDRLRVSYSGLTSVAGPAHAASVRYLNLSGNAITDTAGLTGLTRLVTLDLSSNEISDPRPVIGLPSAPAVRLSGNRIIDARNLTTELGSVSVYDQRGEAVLAPKCAPTALPAIVPASGESVEYFLSAGSYEGGTVLPQPLATIDGDTMTVTETPGLYSLNVRWSTTGSPSMSGSFSVHLLSCFDSAASVAISGDARVGSSLTATVTGVPSTATVAYRWTRDGEPIADATAATYAVTQADAGHSVSAIAELSSPAYAPRTLTSAPLRVPLALTNEQPTIAGNVTVGSVLSATPPAFPAGTTVTFQWLRDGVSISGATASIYRVASADIGRKLSVRTKASLAGYPSQTTTSSTVTALGMFPTVATAGRIITGTTSTTVNVGATLTSKAPTFKSVITTSFSRQWLRNGIAISGATGSTYTVAKADAGARISLRFTANKTHYVSSVSTALDVITIRKLFSTAPTPTLSGSVTAGSTLTATAGTWSPGATLTYQWYRNGKAVSGATKSSYRTATSDGGASIKVKVTAARSGYTTTAKISASVTLRRRLTSTPTPTISGTVKVGYTVKAAVGTWGPGTVSKRLQWYVSGVAVPGATGTSFTVRPGDAYKAITVKVSGSKAGYTTVTRASSAKTAVGIDYSSCAAMRRDYPDGVTLSAGVIDSINGVPGGPITAATFVSSRLYALNDESDADKDGWACEP